MSYAEVPTNKCPYCGTICHADWVDVGVGMVQCGPYYCRKCDASEIGLYDDARLLTDQEKKYGWYAPSSPAGSSVNMIDGQVVDNQTAQEAYRNHFYGRDFTHEEAETWWADHRLKKVKI